MRVKTQPRCRVYQRIDFSFLLSERGRGRSPARTCKVGDGNWKEQGCRLKLLTNHWHLLCITRPTSQYCISKIYTPTTSTYLYFVRTMSTATLHSFMVYAPDYANATERRKEVREQHLTGLKGLHGSGALRAYHYN